MNKDSKGATHTPGPREYAQKYKSARGWMVVRNSATLAVTDYERVADEIVAALNHKLTAPDLLAALEGLLADITEYQDINKLGGENNHWQVIARAAIAKARVI